MVWLFRWSPEWKMKIWESVWDLEVCVKASVSDIVPYWSLPSLEIQHYAFRAVNVMTTCLYPISLRTRSELQEGGFSVALFHMTGNYVGTSETPSLPPLPPGRRENSLHKAKKKMMWRQVSPIAQVLSCVYVFCCIPAFRGCKTTGALGRSRGWDGGVGGANSDFIELIKVKSCLCFPWRACVGSDITVLEQQMARCLWLLSGCGYIQKPIFVLFVALACVGGCWSMLMEWSVFLRSIAEKRSAGPVFVCCPD